MAKSRLTPAKIMQLGTGFWGSKTLLSAIELGLFTELAKGPLDAAALTKRLPLPPRRARDLFDRAVGVGRAQGAPAPSPQRARLFRCAGRARHAQADRLALRQYDRNCVVSRSHEILVCRRHTRN